MFKLNSIGKIGYELVFFLMALGFVVLFFYPSPEITPPGKEGPGKEDCFNRDKSSVLVLPTGALFPGESSTIADPNGLAFERMMSNTPIVKKQVDTHFNKLGKVTYNGKERQVYSAWFNNYKYPTGPDNGPFHVSGVNYIGADGVENLLFVDVTDDLTIKQEGMLYINVYIRKDAAIPNFIIQYCTKHELFSTLYSGFSFLKDQDGNSIPPLKFNTSELKNVKAPTANYCKTYAENCILPANTNFYLFGYGERNFLYDVGSTVKDATKSKPPYYIKPPGGCSSEGCNKYPSGDIEMVYNGQKKTFRMEWMMPAASQWAALFDLDADGNLGQVMFYYAPQQFLGPAVDPGVDLAGPVPSGWNQQTLQLRAMDPKTIPSWGWWTPECKPAIYLYPKTAMNINVKVYPQGIFKYTDPIYNEKSGWNVKAYPSGQLEWLDSAIGIDSRGKVKQTAFYDYLYYESKIPDSSITKPTEGFVIKYEELESFYRKTLPILGLSEKEINDYVEFWQKALPKQDYYFVGIVDPLLVNVLEPITITPSPDAVLRVRLYYEGLTNEEAAQKMATIQAPKYLKTYFERTGFSVVEWGGFVKKDKNHPFTCSM